MTVGILPRAFTFGVVSDPTFRAPHKANSHRLSAIPPPRLAIRVIGEIEITCDQYRLNMTVLP
jgi:hypothetical protein